MGLSALTSKESVDEAYERMREVRAGIRRATGEFVNPLVKSLPGNVVGQYNRGSKQEYLDDGLLRAVLNGTESEKKAVHVVTHERAHAWGDGERHIDHDLEEAIVERHATQRAALAMGGGQEQLAYHEHSHLLDRVVSNAIAEGQSVTHDRIVEMFLEGDNEDVEQINRWHQAA